MNIQPQKKYKILLIGDDCLDTYQYGKVDRISPEAPVPIFSYMTEHSLPGMAANVKKNLENLGCSVDYIFDKTSHKIRIVDIKTNHQLLRIDHDSRSEPVIIDASRLYQYDAVVISDYDKGTVAYSTIHSVTENYKGPIFIDTKKTDLKLIENAFIKINDLEYRKLISEPTVDKLIITKGRQGVFYKGHIIAAKNVEVADVTGAGDTFLSALAYQYLVSQGDIFSSINFAIEAASITVQHTGVYAPKLSEII